MLNAEELGSRLSAFGIGGIVEDDASKHWVRESDFSKMLDYATDKLGVTYLDSARGYELSEAAIGRWLKTKSTTYTRDLVIGSKVSLKKLTGTAGTKEHIASEIDSSLQAIGRDSLDIYWMHAPNPAVPFEIVVESFDRAIRSGKIKSYGVSNVTAPQLKSILQIARTGSFSSPVAVQNEFNLINAKSEQAMVDLCARNGILYFAFSPLASGLLAGRYPSKDEIPADSRMNAWAGRGLPDHWTTETFEDVEKLKALAETRKVSPAALALAACLRNKNVSVTILGPRKTEHLEAARQALSLKLSSSDISLLGSLFNPRP